MMEIRGLDTVMGLYNCGNSEKIYALVLESVYEEGMVKLPQIEESFRKKEYRPYAILVHGLKSVAMSIGAVELSNLAKRLELAAKDGDFTFVADHQDALICAYQELLDELHK